MDPIPASSESSSEVKAGSSPFIAWSITWKLAYLIGVPAVVFGVGGAYLDKYVGTSPLFLGVGFSLAFLASSVGAARMISQMMVEAEKSSPNAKKVPEEPQEEERSSLLP